MINFARLHNKNYSVALFLAVVAWVYTFPVFSQMQWWGIQDWDQHLFYHGVPRLTLLEYGQFPLWNPYYVGGTVMLANPQSRFLSPTFLLHLLVGEVAGIKIEIWFYLAAGLGGAYALGRHYGLHRGGALLAAFVLMLNSMYALTLTVGMTWFMSVAYLPWVFLFFLKGLTCPRYALAGGLGLALMFFGGGVYPLAITLLFLGVYTFFLLVFKVHGRFRPVNVLGIMLIAMLAVGAIKFLPAIEFLQTHPRPVYDYSGYSLNSLRVALFSRNQSLDAIARLPIEQPGFLNGVTGGMDENGMYIGLIPFLLIWPGIGLHSRTRLFLLLGLLIFLWFSFGNRPRAELWSLLHLLPVYNAMRIAQRFRIGFMLCAALLAGFGFETVVGYARQRSRFLGRFLAVAIPALVLADLLAVSMPVFKTAFVLPPVQIAPAGQFYQEWAFPSYNRRGWMLDPAAVPDPRLLGPVTQTSGPVYGSPADPQAAYTSPDLLYASYGSMYPAFLANIGTINGYESANVPRNAVPASSPEYRGEAYLKNTTGEASITGWSPNRLALAVKVSRPGFVVLNQNYYAGWRVQSPPGRVVEEQDGRLAVQVLPEDETIELYYRPASFVAGAAISGVAGLAGLLYGGWLFAAARRTVRGRPGPAPAQSPGG